MSSNKKKLDMRIPTLIANGVQTNHRSFFVIVGDKSQEQVVTLHYLLSKQRVKARPSVLWCYSKDLNFSSNRKKRMNQVKKEIARGTREADQDDPFDLFVSSTDIRYAYYKETDRILGNTYGMCILQDFEALTPNLLARTIETVEGGGIVVLLLKSMSSLKQLYTLSMDVHSRYRTEAHQDTVSRFNERFLLSLGGCNGCLVVDDEMNVLPLSAGKNVKALAQVNDDGLESLTKAQVELKELKEGMKDTLPIGTLLQTCKTLDQAKALLTFVDAISEKTLKSTVTLTAARGRGKSATLGLSIASAIAYGYSNIFLTSPSPENLKTLFEFIFKGLDALGYEEHMDYDILQSSNPAFQKAVVRINLFRDHRQTIQWIQPQDYQMLAQAELLVIDEAAAIPLTVVKKLLGNYLVFMASTVNGYEGTGRALSMKLIKQLREESVGGGKRGGQKTENIVVGRDGKERSSGASPAEVSTSSSYATHTVRSLREIKLEEPIRYGEGDSVEKWLNNLLCLDCCTPSASKTSRLGSSTGCPHPSKCELYYVTRDTLFSYHPVSEAFLQMMMSLYVASHYKNSPNDLQLLSDAPAHHLFVLLPPTDENTTTLPEPLCVIQMCMEGQIAKKSALASLSRGIRAAGDLIPWVVSQQFQDDDFASLSGARVVRIATHPDYIGMGYGARALEQLEAYYNGDIQSLNENPNIVQEFSRVTEEELEGSSLRTEKIGVRDVNKMPPLLLKLSERPVKEHLHWLGVSYGITQQLHKFWKRSGYTPVYIRQTSNELTGEHTCIMLKTLHKTGGHVKIAQANWLNAFSSDFKRRFIELLAYQFKTFSPTLVLSVMEGASSSTGSSSLTNVSTASQVALHFSPFDLKRLESYSQNLLDYHVILDLLHPLSRLYFLNALQKPSNGDEGNEEEQTNMRLSAVQSAIFLGLGLQKKSVEDLEKELGISVSQILALFAKGIRKIWNYLHSVEEEGARMEVDENVGASKSKSKSLKRVNESSAEGGRLIEEAKNWNPAAVSLDEDLEQAGSEYMNALKEKQRELVDSLDLEKYGVGGDEQDWKKMKIDESITSTSKTISIPNSLSTKGSSRKHKEAKGVADALLEKHHGKGTFDPSGVVARVKAAKNKKQKKTK